MSISIFELKTNQIKRSFQMYNNIISRLKSKGIVFEKGLSQEEIYSIYKIYNIKFPKSLEIFLKTALPVSNGFYNWRDFSKKNIKYIKQMLCYPQNYIRKMTDEVEWNIDWGIEPKEYRVRNESVIERLSKAPVLIPIFSHRYIPIIDEENPPIISVHGTDIIYYGTDLMDYLFAEFIDDIQYERDFQRVIDIPFWSEIM